MGLVLGKYIKLYCTADSRLSGIFLNDHHHSSLLNGECLNRFQKNTGWIQSLKHDIMVFISSPSWSFGSIYHQMRGCNFFVLVWQNMEAGKLSGQSLLQFWGFELIDAKALMWLKSSTAGCRRSRSFIWNALALFLCPESTSKAGEPIKVAVFPCDFSIKWVNFMSQLVENIEIMKKNPVYVYLVVVGLSRNSSYNY